MINGKLFILNDRQYDIIRAGLSVLKQEVIDSQYEAITAEQIDACIKKKLNIEETKTQLEYCREHFNGQPGQIACLDGVWYQILQRGITELGEVEYALYTKPGWIPASQISEIRDRETIITMPEN